MFSGLNLLISPDVAFFSRESYGLLALIGYIGGMKVSILAIFGLFVAFIKGDSA